MYYAALPDHKWKTTTRLKIKSIASRLDDLDQMTQQTKTIALDVSASYW